MAVGGRAVHVDARGVFFGAILVCRPIRIGACGCPRELSGADVRPGRGELLHPCRRRCTACGRAFVPWGLVWPHAQHQRMVGKRRADRVVYHCAPSDHIRASDCDVCILPSPDFRDDRPPVGVHGRACAGQLWVAAAVVFSSGAGNRHHCVECLDSPIPHRVGVAGVDILPCAQFQGSGRGSTQARV